MLTGSFIGEWKSGLHSISLYHAANQFSARIQDQAGSRTEIDSKHIKCGILGTTNHDLLIQKIDRLGKEHFSVCCYPFQGQPNEVWVFEALQGAAPWIKKAKENLAQRRSEKEEATDCYQKALKNFDTAFRIQEKQKGDTAELNSAILQLKKELFLLQIKRDLPFYLSSPKEREDFDEIIESYKEGDLFSCLSDYLAAFEDSTFSPCQLFLSALMDEHFNRPDSAIQHYLRLAEHHPDPLPCFKKVEELVKQTIVSDPFALPHFLEKLDGARLIKLRQTTHYPEDLERLLLQKDVLRMTFEKSLATLNQHSSQTKTPTCFICFNVEEADVAKWLEQVLVPDLDRMGIQPLFCFRDLNPGKAELNNFQGLVRGADQVIVICTPDLKRKCDERKKNPIGVAGEIRLARERYNDSDKYETIFLLYLKGTRKESCPSEFFEPILGVNLNKIQDSPIFNYYESAFEFFGGMRGISRPISRQVKDDFLSQVDKIFAGEINREALEKWRQVRQSQIEYVLKAVQEQVTKMTKMVHLPLPPEDFTGRVQELQDLHTACQRHHRVAITGLGGVGKTALALKYANDHQADYQFIYHIPAGTSQQIRDGLLQLADELHLPKVEKIEERLELLKRRLDQDHFEQKYLLIFDGIDQVEAFDELNKYLPERGSCLLLTSRMPEQPRLRNFGIIELKPFSLEEAVSYLLGATGSVEKEKAKELAERLGRLPLALKHAAGYIRSRGISIREYIQKFDQFKLRLFEDKRLNLLKDEEKTILTTWNISLDAIETVHKCSLAKEVIAFFAFLGQAPIPLDLVKEWFKTIHPETEELDLDDALMHLCGYSMIDGSSDFYQVHLLVQQVTQYQMTNPQQVFEKAFLTLNAQLKKFQEEEVSTWSSTKSAIPHALSLFDKKELMGSIALKEQHKFMELLGYICRNHGNFYRALEIWQDSLRVAKQSRDHPLLQKANKAMAISYNHIGIGLESLGKHDKALKYYQKALNIWLKFPEDEHHYIAANYNNMGRSLGSLGKHNAALEYYQKALESWRKIYGEEDPTIATCYNNIGLSLEVLGKCEEALEYQQKALQIQLKVYDEEHPAVEPSYHNIGLSLKNLGKYEEALKYFQKALKIVLKVHGDEHPNVALSYNNMGWSLEGMGKYQEALDYIQKALEIRKKVYGEEHPEIALSYNNIGSTLRVLGKFDEVLEYHQKSLKILLKIYGEEHSHVAATYNQIGAGLKELGKHEKALGYFQKALRIQLKVFGEKHPDVAASYNNIGSSWQNLGKYDEALSNHQNALKITVQLYGEEHPHVALSYSNIGSTWHRLGNLEEALKYFQKALGIQLKVDGEGHPHVAVSYGNIGSAWQRLGKYKESLEYFQNALDIRLKVYGAEHLDVAIIYHNMGTSLQNLRKYNEALEYSQKALNIWLKVYEEKHPSIAISYSNIGTILDSLGKYDEALDNFRKALNIWLKLYGEEHPDVAKCYSNVGAILEGLRRYNESFDCHYKALQIYEKIYSSNHPELIRSKQNLNTVLKELVKNKHFVEQLVQASKT